MLRLDIQWAIEKWGFAMTLSKEVPNKIIEHLPKTLKRLAAQVDLDPEYLMRKAIFATNPGGPKIIETIAQSLDLKEKQIEASQKILCQG